MCDPITIAGIALSGAGMAANSIGAGRVADATAGALRDSLQRQQNFDREAAGVNARSLGLYNDFQGQQDAKAASLADAFGKAVAPVATSGTNAPAATSANTRDAEAAARGLVQAFSNNQATTSAKARSFGDVLHDDTLAQGRDAIQLGQIADFKRGDTGVLGLKLNAASHAGDPWNLAAQLAGGVGNVGIQAGLTGAAKKLSLNPFM